MASSLEWSTLNPPLSAATLEAIENLGFQKMTPVQAATIPVFTAHKDVCVQATTGSGKTLAFLIPILEILCRLKEPLKRHQVGAIVITPTRELAQQILDVLHDRFAPFFVQFRVMGLIGGTDTDEVESAIRRHGANIIVATPGRLEATLERVDVLDVKHLEVLVLDEADRLLDMGFEVQLNNILKRLPKQRRTGLFSATQTQQVQELARAGLRNAVRIELEIQYKKGSQQMSQITPTTLRNVYEIVEPRQKLEALVKFLAEHAADKKIIVFFLTCACVDYFSKVLPNVTALKGIELFGMHGKMLQKKRLGVYTQFASASQKAGVLLCTDVVARGIDIPDVDWIVQFDPPQDPSFFVHRIGRTARMGRAGHSLLYLLPSEDAYIDFLRVKKVPIRPYEPSSSTTPAVSSNADSNAAASTTAGSSNGSSNSGDAATPSNASHTALSALAQVRQQALDDRDVMEKGQKAFVSYIRGYKEHKCNFIFLLNQLDVGGVAEGFGLLFFPKMPDLKHLQVQFPPCEIPANQIKFKDPKREQQRLVNAAKRAEERQSEKKERIMKERQIEKLKAKQGPKRRRKKLNQEYAAEWDELQKEARLLKKLKKGTISKKQFAREAGESESDGDGASGDDDDDVDAGDGDDDNHDDGAAGGKRAKAASSTKSAVTSKVSPPVPKHTSSSGNDQAVDMAVDIGVDAVSKSAAGRAGAVVTNGKRSREHHGHVPATAAGDMVPSAADEPLKSSKKPKLAQSSPTASKRARTSSIPSSATITRQVVAAEVDSKAGALLDQGANRNQKKNKKKKLKAKLKKKMKLDHTEGSGNGNGALATESNASALAMAT